MARLDWLDEVLRLYFHSGSGLTCMCFGIVLVLVSLCVLALAERVALFLFLIFFGVIVFACGFLLLMFKCCCPSYVPTRHFCENSFFFCIP